MQIKKWWTFWKPILAVVRNSGLLMDVERDGLRVTEFDKFNKVILIEFGITCQDWMIWSFKELGLILFRMQSMTTLSRYMIMVFAVSPQ